MKLFKALKTLLTLGFLFATHNIFPEVIEKPMVIIIPSYNNIEWYKKNLYSALSQNYSNFRIIYIDDNSCDGTTKAVEEYLKKNDKNRRTEHLHNTTRLGAMENLYHAIHSCDDHEIAVLLDGDDWLSHKNVLKQLNEIYSSRQIWFTHGTFIDYPMGNVSWCEPYPPEVIAQKSFRKFKCPSHLRTFYAWLFKKIQLEDFLYEGDFIKMAWDMAIMYPLSEMAGERHYFIRETNYVYNMANPINDNKVDPDLQNFLDRLIRNRPVYERLEALDIPEGY